MGAATRTARDFCTVCGWSVHGPRCDACGEYPAPLALEDSMRRFVPRGHEGLDPIGLEKATEAFRRGDYPRALAACVGTETNLTVRAVQLPEGPGWALIGRDSSVFVSLDAQAMHLVVESPIARLPRAERVSAMRLALEMCDAEEMSSRVCLRDDLLVLRFVMQLGAVAPPLVRHVIREMMHMAERYAEMFVAAFDARTAALGDARGGGGWDSLGRKRTLATLATAPTRRSVVPPPPSTLRPAEAPTSLLDDDLPPILAPMFAGDGARSVLADPDLPPVLAFSDAARAEGFDALPAVLAPPDAVPQTARLGAVPPLLMTPLVAERDLSPETARLGTPMPFPTPVARRRTISGNAIGGETPTRPSSLEAESPDMTPRRPTVRTLSREADTPTDKLCELLHQAQALATALSFQERPATMLLLVRAAVYRSIHEFGEATPDAVAYLYRTTAAATRMIWPSAGAGGKRPAAMPMAEPALLAMERIVSSRASVPKERAFVVEPLATATQAREHLARYVEEIEASPVEPALRHFLTLGALMELLTRTRLPAQTSQRLKDIIAHALRDGPKQSSIDLMMTALKRIVAG